MSHNLQSENGIHRSGGTPEGEAGDDQTTPAQASPLLLIVDDFEDSRAMYCAYARVCGFEVDEAADGISALEKANLLLPQCIVIDLALPKLDGWEVIRRLRADPRTRSIPVIAVSGHTLEAHTRAAQEAGCDDFLPKPCLPDVLVAKIRKVLKMKTPASRGLADA